MDNHKSTQALHNHFLSPAHSPELPVSGFISEEGSLSFTKIDEGFPLLAKYYYCMNTTGIFFFLIRFFDK